MLLLFGVEEQLNWRRPAKSKYGFGSALIDSRGCAQYRMYDPREIVLRRAEIKEHFERALILA